MHSFSFTPVLVLDNSESSHTMSAVVVLESNPWDVVVPVHFEEQGEFGVTCRASSGSITARRRSRCKDRNAISNGLFDDNRGNEGSWVTANTPRVFLPK